ncbi:hypothetical protein GEU84_011640 [Fertoebacter nigrum]|uniref:Phage tail protein n=1 Tax=Fertoeibacter niger TaxID=2656921 RepID=A0A8X8GXQ2_9RHOB|nr:hypothetical protein [Fertoeibacter niger]NUB45042.1 hypothetical protein [Fertoeibacter niger]
MTGKALIPVLAAPHLDPAAGRIALDLPEGLTLAQILSTVLPGATPDELLRCRVALVTEQGSQIVLPGVWHRVRPRPGVRVVIRVIPGKDGLRSLLSIVVSIAAIAAGQFWGLKVGQLLGLGAGTAGAVGSALVGVGVSIVGNLLINALIPPDKPESRDAQNRYLDPPYWGCEGDYGKALFAPQDFARLAAVLGALKGRFILSLNDVQGVRDTFAAFQMAPVKTTYTIASKGAVPDRAELLISNFTLPGVTP